MLSVLIALLALTLPLWLLAGFGDWWCHRRTRIETTAGPRESALHLVLYLLIAVPVVLGLILEMSTTLLVLMAVCVLAHSGVSLWDTSYAQPRRYIAPVEQMIHSHLEMLPVFALALIIVLHWHVVLEPRWSLEARQSPLPAVWTRGVLIALLPGLLMIFEEWMRGRRARSHA
jgi:hypothetical protein